MKAKNISLIKVIKIFKKILALKIFNLITLDFYKLESNFSIN